MSLESLYGTNLSYVLLVSVEITLPKVKRLRLIFPVSFAIFPVAKLSLSRSEPAKSTKDNFPYRLTNSFPCF